MWAGARATYGFTVAKLCFEVKVFPLWLKQLFSNFNVLWFKVTEDLPVPQLEESEPNHHIVRVGWSADATTCNLGIGRKTKLYLVFKISIVI